MRIVSLVPSLTELLFDLGLGANVVGVTKFCVHPNEAKQHKTKIGGTKNPSIERILHLKPDLVIANREENRRENVLQLMEHTKVLVTDISNVNEAISAIQKIGRETGTGEAATSITNEITDARAQLRKLQQLSPLPTPPKILYLIWQNPWMSIGADTFIHAMISELGATSVTASLLRYPELTEEAINALAPDEIWLSDEPYPFGPNQVHTVQQQFPFARVQLVSGEVYSWYGSRMISTYNELMNQYRLWTISD